MTRRHPGSCAPSPASGQRGTVLVVALVLLVALTLLSAATAMVAKAQLNITRNQVAEQAVFQGAESAISVVLTRPDFGTQPEVDMTTQFSPEMQLRTTASYKGSTMVPEEGFSLGGQVAAFHYEIVGSASSDSESEAVHIQGAYVIGPAQ